MMQTESESLLDAALAHVPFEGMNDAALRAGARDIDMNIAMAGVYFPQGGAGLAAAYHRRGDQQLQDWLQATPPDGRFRDRVVAAVMQRLTVADAELVRAGAAVLALPPHAALGARLIWETADIIWTGLGDESQDVNWYSKRASLSAVIGATVLFWLGDDSPAQADTRAFLERRVDGVMRFEKLRSGLRKLPGAATLGAMTTGWIRAPRSRDLPGRTSNR